MSETSGNKKGALADTLDGLAEQLAKQLIMVWVGQALFDQLRKESKARPHVHTVHTVYLNQPFQVSITQGENGPPHCVAVMSDDEVLGEVERLFFGKLQQETRAMQEKFEHTD